MSYIEFFDFKEHPFRITPDVAFFYSSPTHLEALQSLKYFADSDEGFLVLTGEPGTGKTITLRKFLNEVSDTVEYAYVLFPSLEPEDMFRVVLEDFGYKINSRMSKNSLFSGFRDFLTQKKAQGKKLILVIDEAQNLPVRTLEELRILSNLETEKEKLIQFIIAGQPELDKKLASEDLRQLKQRISINIRLEYMNQYEMAKYVAFRLAKGGFQGQYPDNVFYSQLFALTKGNPRLVNLVMERSLMSAYVDQSKHITLKHIENAAVSLKLKAAQPAMKYAAIAAAVLSLGLLGGAYYFYNKMNTPKWEEPPAVEQPIQQSVQQPIQQPAQQPAQQPVQQSVQQPVQQPVQTQPVQKDVEIVDVNTVKQQEQTKPIQPQPVIKPEPVVRQKEIVKKPEPVKQLQPKRVIKAEPPQTTAKTVVTETAKKPEQTNISSQEFPVGFSANITARVLNIRSGPDKSYDVAAKLMKGDTVTIRGFSGDWFEVSFAPVDGVGRGWIHRDYVVPAK